MRTAAFSALFLLFLACDKTPPPGGDGKSDAAPAASTAADTTKGTVRASGSSALQPLVNAAKEKFEATNKGVSVEVSAGGSKKGLSDCASGAVDIGDSDIFAPPDLAAQGLVDHKVAAVGFAVMANKGPYNAKVSAITLEQMGKVFTGDIKNWKDLGGDPAPIVVINRAAGSGTRVVFGNAVLGGDKFVESQTEDNSGALVAKLKQTKGAISYLALSFKDDELWVASIKKGDKTFDPSDANIQSGDYPIWSYEHMYTKGEATGATKDFIAYMTGADFQTKVLPTVKGFISVSSMKATKDKD